MRHVLITRLPSTLLLLLACAATCGADSPPVFRPGAPVPVLTLPEMRDDRPMSVVDFRGRRLLLLVFASW